MLIYDIASAEIRLNAKSVTIIYISYTKRQNKTAFTQSRSLLKSLRTIIRLHIQALRKKVKGPTPGFIIPVTASLWVGIKCVLNNLS